MSHVTLHGALFSVQMIFESAFQNHKTAHDGWVRGLTMTRSNKVISVGVDKMIKIWDSDEFSEENSIISIVGSSPFTSGSVLIPLPVK